MASYRAEIEIGVTGIRSLEQLRSAINQTATAVDSLNNVVGARGGLVQSIQNYVTNLNRAAVSLERVGAGTQAETKAVQEYVKALGEANAARARQNSLVAQEIANQRRVNPSTAPFGQQGPALPPALVKRKEIQQAWDKFFAEAAEIGQELQSNAKAKNLNTKTSWNNFFAEAAEIGQELQSAAKAKSLNTKTSWNNFFAEAQNVAADLLKLAQKTAAEIRAREGASSEAARKRLSAEAERRTRIQNAGFGAQGPQPLQVKALGPSPTLKEINQYIQELNTFIENVPFKSELYKRGIAQLEQINTFLDRGSARKEKLPKTKSSMLETAVSDVQRTSRAGGGPFAVDQPFSLNELKKAKLSRAVNTPGVLDAILGGGFPMLFGGGPGAILGGAAGGLIGGSMGGMAGMALSIGLSAVGQKLDQIFGEAIRATQELGKALSSLDASKLRETTVFVTAEFENQNRLLLEAGQYEQARATATKEVAAQTGALGSSTADAANASNLLKSAFDNMMSPVNSLLANISGPFVAALAGALNIVGLIAKGLNVVVSGVGQLIKGITEWAIKLVGGQKALDRVRELTKATSEETEALRAAAEAEIDAGVRNVQLKKQLLDIERARLEGTNRSARASQIEADFRSKAVQIQADKENEIRQIYAEGSRLTAQQLNLKIQTAEATAAQKLQEAGITAEKARRKLLDNEAIAKLQAQQTIQENQSQSAQTLYSTESRRLQIATARLEAEKEFALSLNQQVGIVNKISELRKGQAQVEYQAAVASLQASVQQAANELTITETKYRQNEADVEQVHSARAKLATAQLHAAAEGMIADLQLEQNNYLIEIQRRQAVVNAYAESYARSTADATRNIEQQVNALNNRASLLNAISQATQTINNIEIQSLERELERNVATDRRAAIIERIYDLEVQNAKVVLEATRANIRAELARADAAYNTVLLKYKELEAVVNIARAQGVVNNAHYEALASQRSALRIAADNLNTAKQIGDVQWKAADAVYKAAVNAAKLRSEMLSATSAAQAFGDASVRAASAWSVFSKQTDPTKAGYYAERVNEQGRKETVRTFTVGTNPEPEMTYLPGARNAAGAGSESGYAGPINITTGPVMQQDSQRYVSLGDLESAMQQVVNTMMGNNRSAGGRRYAGIR